jgi:hypothetical protein
MRLSDRFRRWRNPAQWQDEHPQVTDGDDASESEELTAERRSHEEHSTRRAVCGFARPADTKRTRLWARRQSAGLPVSPPGVIPEHWPNPLACHLALFLAAH